VIDVRPILALLDLSSHGAVHTSKLEDAIVETVKATNTELERIVREMFARFGRDVTEQDIAAVLARPVQVGTLRELTGDYRAHPPIRPERCEGFYADFQGARRDCMPYEGCGIAGCPSWCPECGRSKSTHYLGHCRDRAHP
jgi:hypothetical protein